MQQLTIFKINNRNLRLSARSLISSYENLSVFLFLGIIASVFIYLVSAAFLNYAIYSKTSLTRQINLLKAEIRTLSLDLAQKRSLIYLQSETKDLNLIKADMKSIKYVEQGLRPVALDGHTNDSNLSP